MPEKQSFLQVLLVKYNTHKKLISISVLVVLLVILPLLLIFANKTKTTNEIKTSTNPAQKQATSSSKSNEGSQQKTNTDEMTQPEVVLPTEVKDVQIAFEGKKSVFIYNNSKTKAVPFGNGNYPSISPDKSKIAYVDFGTNIFIYDISTGQTKTLPSIQDRLRHVGWSPDGKYIATGSGSDIIGGTVIYEYPSGKNLFSFTTWYDAVNWINNNELVYADHQSISPIREGLQEGDYGKGLTKLNVITGNKNVLLQSSSKNDFTFIKDEGGIIYYSRSEFNSDLTDSIISYWQMKENGTGILQLNQKPKTLEDTVAEKLPNNFIKNKVSFAKVNGLYPNWILFEYVDSSDYSTDKVYLINVITGKLIQIGVGFGSSW